MKGLNENIERIKSLMSILENKDGTEDYFRQKYTDQSGPHDESDMAPDGMDDDSDVNEEDSEEFEIKEEGEESTSTTGTGAGSATKWSQGHTKGPGNQTGITKWADVVGSQLKRGHGNPLK
jgi:hypothetical protein